MTEKQKPRNLTLVGLPVYHPAQNDPEPFPLSRYRDLQGVATPSHQRALRERGEPTEDLAQQEALRQRKRVQVAPLTHPLQSLLPPVPLVSEPPPQSHIRLAGLLIMAAITAVVWGMILWQL